MSSKCVTNIDADTCCNVCFACTYRTNQINSINLRASWNDNIDNTLLLWLQFSDMSYSPFVLRGLIVETTAAVSREHRQIGQRSTVAKCSVEHVLHSLVVRLLRGDKIVLSSTPSSSPSRKCRNRFGVSDCLPANDCPCGSVLITNKVARLSPAGNRASFIQLFVSTPVTGLKSAVSLHAVENLESFCP